MHLNILKKLDEIIKKPNFAAMKEIRNVKILFLRIGKLWINMVIGIWQNTISFKF
jgi:hypothetical protein